MDDYIDAPPVPLKTKPPPKPTLPPIADILLEHPSPFARSSSTPRSRDWSNTILGVGTLDPSQAEQVNTALASTISMLSMLDVMHGLDTSNSALRSDMAAIAVHIKELTNSFATHFRAHPVAAPDDSNQDAMYYITTIIGRFIRELLQDLSGTLGSITLGKDITDITSLIDPQIRREHHIDNIAIGQFRRWQRLDFWWQRYSGGLSDEELHRFYSRLRWNGLVHLPQLGRCTCSETLQETARSLLLLVLKLEFAGVRYVFDRAERLRDLYDISSGMVSTSALDVIWPPLRIRRSTGLWINIYRGNGVAPQGKDDLTSIHLNVSEHSPCLLYPGRQL